ncbi:MAG: hypothetical protein ACI4XA_00275 [Oscillospiraceae bacterium]
MKNHSVLRKLIPAAAMLTMSAVMLSTATYAWFTMNKEVEMTGLNLSATAGEGMEISLAAVSTANVITFSGAAFVGDHPSDDPNAEIGWKSAVNVGNYYSDIGKIKPASSVNGVTFFDATDASNGGKSATKFKAIALGNTNMALLTTRDAFNAGNTTIESNGTAGYYVDIPVHIRTSKVKPNDLDTTGDLYCKMIINSNDAGDELYKAVRVAFIPVTASTGSTTNIFGCNADYYETGKAVSGVDASGVGEKDTVVVTNGGFVTDSAYADGVGVDSGLNIPYAAAAGEYGHLDFTVRVWLEGESTSCFDSNAGQSWNISFMFSLGEFETT